MVNLVVCLMGPTAAGKTNFAVELITRFPFEIISVDSAMIYREMNIGTAKPSKEELEQAPHHLIDIIDPTDSYSAAQFCADTKALCQGIYAKGKIPLLVGGTMMYFNALQNGLAVLPEANEAIRQQIETEAAQNGWTRLHQKLSEIDPVSAARIHANDSQRIERALEVFYLTGKRLSDFLAQQSSDSEYQFVNLALVPNDRSWLHDQIACRFKHMLTLGFVEEVKSLQERWHLNNDVPSMRCVGYRQVLEYLQGDFDHSQLIEKGVAATRQLAKRQLTWLRHWENAYYYDPQNKTFSAEIVAKLSEILDNNSL